MAAFSLTKLTRWPQAVGKALLSSLTRLRTSWHIWVLPEDPALTISPSMGSFNTPSLEFVACVMQLELGQYSFVWLTAHELPI